MARASDLERELRALDERATTLGENDDLPRGKMPGLFRALRAAASEPDASERLLEAARRLGARLADRPLLEPIVELAREVPAVRAPLEAALEARAAAPDAWAIEKQARVIAGSGSVLEAIERLTRDPPALELSPEEARALVEARLASSRRDRTSLEVTRGALRLIASRAREASVAALAARVVEAETRRAGDEEPELALVALEVLAGAEPLARLRAAKRLESRVERKKVRERAALLAEEAASALHASKEDVTLLLADDLARDRELAASTAALTDPDERREREAARARVAAARRDLADRLERALGTGRAWRLSIFRAAFVENELAREVASRLVWVALPSSRATSGSAAVLLSFRPTEKMLEDVFSGPVEGLGEETLVRVAHPLDLDADELALWRERLFEPRGAPAGRPDFAPQPCPQLHRLVRRETEPLERFVGRELHQEAMAELGKKRGYRGLPLRGDGPWEVARDLPGFGAVIVVSLERIAGQIIVQKKKDALRVLDDPDARPRERRDAAPRARVVKVEVVGEASDVARAEAALDLHALTDPLAAGSDAWFGEWQKRKFKDPRAAWREAQLLMAKGSQAAVEVRAALVRAFAPKLRIEGRLAIVGGDDGLFIDLGTGQAFEGPLRDWVPPWRLAERQPADLALAWPFEPDRDEDTRRVVSSVVGASRVVESPP